MVNKTSPIFLTLVKVQLKDVATVGVLKYQ